MKISILKSCAGLTFSFIEGQDVADKISLVETDNMDKPLEEIKIETITIEE